MNFAEPSENRDMIEAGFFANLANGGLLGGLARLNVALGDGPAILRILNKEDFNVALVGSHPKDDTTSGRLTDDFLDGRFLAKSIAKFLEGAGFFNRKCLGNLALPCALRRNSAPSLTRRGSRVSL